MTKAKTKKLPSGGERGNNEDLKKLLSVSTTHNIINVCIKFSFV
jgi:hypothetical protein